MVSGPDSSQPEFALGDAPLTLEAVAAIARALEAVRSHGPTRVRLGGSARQRMQQSRAFIDHLARGGADVPSVYGVNTGFGALAEVRVTQAQIGELQRNLVRSHAAGVGTPLPREVVRAMLLLRAQVLTLGY